MESESAVLEDYESVLEELTFNSKPIINMLTMKADKYRVYAPAIVDLVKTRFFKVRQEYKIPTLYLMDSMIKNLGGDFLEELAKGIVGVFCHAFESMNDPKIRIALYKLRQTWPPYIPVRKLAAIDEHIHAIDPNWPITAQEPSSPTIFLNPKFLESKDEAAAKRRINKITTTATANRDSPPLPKKSILKQRSQQPAASKPTSNSLVPPTTDAKGRRSPQSVGTEKQSSKSSSTVTASSKQSKPQDSAKSPETKRERGGGGDRGGIGSKYHIPKKTKKVQFHSSTTSASPPPSSSSSSPVKPKNSSSPPHSPSSSSSSSSSRSSTSSSSRDSVKDKRKKLLAQQRQIKTNKQLSMGILPLPQDNVSLDRVMQKHKRSASPSPEKRHVEPRTKRPRSASPTVAMDTRDGVVPVEGDRGRGLTGRKHRSEEIPVESDENTKRFKMEAKTELVRNERRGGEGADMMDIKDLIKQQDFMLEQAQKSLKSDTLTPDQRDKLVKQVEQLLELQKGSPHVKEERTDKYNESVSRGDDSASYNRDSVSFSHAPISVSVSHSHDSVSHFRDSVSHSHDFVSHPQESVSRQHDYSYDSVSHSHDSVSHSRDSVSHSRDLGSRSRPPGAEIPPPPQHRTLLPFPPPPRDYIPPQHNFDDFPPPRGPRLPPPPRSNITFTRGQGGKRTRVRRPFRGRHRSPLPPYIMRGGPIEHRAERGGHPPRPPPQENKNMPFVADLYEKLKSSGLLPEKDGGAPPPPPLPTRRTPILPLIRLNIKELKLVYKDLYMSLHEGEPCTSCGLRFRDDQRDEYQAHLDWHYHENRLDKDGTRATMRNWFLHPDDWVSFEGSLLINQNEPLLTAEQEDNEDSVGAEDKPTGISCKVLPGEDTQVCGVCHEQLEQFWEEDEEEWHFKDALRTPDDALYHSYCYVDSKESLGLLSVESSPISEMPKPLNI